jgi:Lar family restriction alleviation protein
MSELKPCPFCGSGAIEVLEWVDYTKIGCLDCNYGIIYQDCDEEDAVDYWNTRPVEDAKDREIERLKAEVTRYRRALHNLKEDCQKRLHWKNSSLEGLFLHEVITHIDAELDYAPDSTKGVEK